MTVAYFDCCAGISGDMTLGALIDAGAERALPDATIEALRLGDEVSIEVRHETRGHVGGTRVLVETVDRVERTIPALRAVVEQADAPDRVKASVLSAIDSLARAARGPAAPARARRRRHARRPDGRLLAAAWPGGRAGLFVPAARTSRPQ